MSLKSIGVPDAIRSIPVTTSARQLIDEANRRINAFMSSGRSVSENFVTCDFQLLDQALTWLEQQHLLAGDRFCELGSGFGVAAMLASLHGLEAIGIEIETELVEQSDALAGEFGLDTSFYCGSFVPRDSMDVELAADMKHVETQEDDIYDEIGLEPDDFDLFFAFPWPGEHVFFEAVFDECAASGALLLTFRGRDGMDLVRKA